MDLTICDYTLKNWDYLLPLKMKYRISYDDEYEFSDRFDIDIVDIEKRTINNKT